MRRAALALLVLTVAAATPAAAQTLDARLADLRLATAVRLALVRDAATRALDVDVTARDGAVRLGGAGAGNGQAERVARAVAGVRSVDGAGGVASAPVERVLPDGSRPEPSRAETPAAERTRAEPPPASAWRARTEAASEPAGPASVTVARGDTLFSLARRHGTTVEALRRLNGLGPTDGIAVGRTLRVR